MDIKTGLLSKASDLRDRFSERRDRIREIQKRRDEVHDKIDDVDIEITEARDREASMERKVVEVHIRKDQLARERIDNEVALEEYTKGVETFMEDEEHLRYEVDSKRREAERVRYSATRVSLFGEGDHSHGTMSKAVSILHQVEDITREADDLEKKADEHLGTLEQYRNLIKLLTQKMKDNEEKTMLNFQDINKYAIELKGMKENLIEMMRKSAEYRLEALRLRQEEEKEGFISDILEERVNLAELALELVDKDSVEIALELGLLELERPLISEEHEPET